VAPGWTEIEAGVEWDRYADHTRGGQAPVLLKIGLAPRVQLSLMGFGVVAPGGAGQGIGDVSAGVKWRFVEHTRVGGDLAILPSIKLPTGSVARGTGTGTTDVELLLISSRTIHGIAIDLNAAYWRRTGNGTTAPRESALWTASYAGQPWGAVGWTAEMFGYPSLETGTASIVAVLVGPTWEARKFLVFDTGIIAPLAGPQPRAVYAGLTWNMGRLWNAARANPAAAHSALPFVAAGRGRVR
ncbi:MAG: transporter, partial [Vicinamibacterales bacterium]